MKKAFLILLFVMIIPVSLFASSGFGFSVGAAVTIDRNIGGIISDDIKTIKAQDFSFGIDMDMKVFIVDVDFIAFYRKGLDDKFGAGGMFSLNVGPDLGPFRISLGLAYDWAYNIQIANKFTFGSNESDLGKNFTHSPLNLRAALDINISKVLVKIYGVLPTNLTLSSFKIGEMFKDFNYKNIKVGLVVGINLV